MWDFKSSYKVIETIGEGLNASVYKVTKFQPNLKTNHTFALKVLKQSSDLKVFKLEFENLLKAHGRHLVKYCGWERYSSRPALLLEYIDGVTLHELVNSFRLNNLEVDWVQQETLLGLQELQDSGLFHGDLSLKNIMIQRDGHLKLIDFGLSHWSTQKVEITPEFADPELFKGVKPSFATDLVSLKKIIQKISAREIGNSTVHNLSSPPNSLIEKVQSLKEPSQKTQSFCLKRSDQKKADQKFKFALWSFASLLFFTPASAYNSLQLESVYQIRSKNWLSITNKKGQTCFTPCSIKLNSHTLEKIRWRGQKKSGVVNVYTSSKKVLYIDI